MALIPDILHQMDQHSKTCPLSDHKYAFHSPADCLCLYFIIILFAIKPITIITCLVSSSRHLHSERMVNLPNATLYSLYFFKELEYLK